MIFTSQYYSPVGDLLLAERNGGLIGLWTQGQKHDFGVDSGAAKEETVRRDTPSLRQVKDWLDRYFAGKKPEIRELCLTPTGGPFRQAVWKILTGIPYGETVTYGEIAGKMAVLTGKKKMSAQAVGGAVGHNPISIIIPCHRVVGSDGSLVGYAGGMETKCRLLTHEGVDMTKFFVPGKRAY